MIIIWLFLQGGAQFSNLAYLLKVADLMIVMAVSTVPVLKNSECLMQMNMKGGGGHSMF